MGKIELTYDMICGAGKGEQTDREQILAYYDGYITALATVETTDYEGNCRKYVDEDMKAEIQMRYLEALPKCKVLSE